MYQVWNNFKTTLLMASLMGLCLGVGYLIGGPRAMVPALVIGGIMNVIAFFCQVIANEFKNIFFILYN